MIRIGQLGDIQAMVAQFTTPAVSDAPRPGAEKLDPQSKVGAESGPFQVPLDDAGAVDASHGDTPACLEVGVPVLRPLVADGHIRQPVVEDGSELVVESALRPVAG
ncbi:hypothetical protein ES707_15842 [subsurface metagenome]